MSVTFMRRQESYSVREPGRSCLVIMQIRLPWKNYRTRPYEAVIYQMEPWDVNHGERGQDHSSDFEADIELV